RHAARRAGAHARRQRGDRLVRAPPRRRARERAARRRRGAHPGGRLHHRRRARGPAVRPPGPVVRRPRDRHRRGAHHRPARRPPRALKQEYHEFLLQRIEEYKNALAREELLEIGDEAVRELEENAAGQYLLTEVLLLEHVDRIIARRLRLPAFPRWRVKHRALRAAQREPTHWGLEADGPLVGYARRLEPGDLAVVVGAAALPSALFIAAHDAEVF